MSRLTVIIPAFNEAPFIGTLLERVFATGLSLELILVDDGSTDGTEEKAKAVRVPEGCVFRILSHEGRKGKGAAIQTGLRVAKGDLILIQDADLEYSPLDYPALLAPFSEAGVEVVYGSRNLRRNPWSSWSFYWGGRFLSWSMNLLFDSRLTDEATGYKVFRRALFNSLELRETGFGFCPEVTAKILRRGIRIREVPISYVPRSRGEGKKIRLRHGLQALWIMVRERVAANGR